MFFFCAKMKCSPLRISTFVTSLLWKLIKTNSFITVWNLKLFKNKLYAFGVQSDGLSQSWCRCITSHTVCHLSHLFLKIKYRYQNIFFCYKNKNCGKNVNPVSQVWNNLA